MGGALNSAQSTTTAFEVGKKARRKDSWMSCASFRSMHANQSHHFLESLSLPPGCYAYEEPTTGLMHCRGKDSFAGILEPTARMLCYAKVQLRMSRRAYRLWNHSAQRAKAKEKHEHANTCVFPSETLISGYPGLFSLAFENPSF